MTQPYIRPVVTLTTDFGLGSPYVAQMKGVLLSRNPDLQLVDISHDIPPQDIRRGALVLDDVCRRFPPRTIHVAVVDPGVGTDREIVFVKAGTQRFLAPNNGLLTFVAHRTPPDLIVAVTNRLYFLPDVSPTFHGRDIVAPVAAHVSLGLHPERLGEQRHTLVTFAIAEPRVEPWGISGRVLHIDSFGNIITNITVQDLVAAGITAGSTSSTPRVRYREVEVTGIVRTYGERPAGTLVALVGSSGRLELAVVQGHAASRLAAVVDDEIQVAR